MRGCPKMKASQVKVLPKPQLNLPPQHLRKLHLNLPIIRRFHFLHRPLWNQQFLSLLQLHEFAVLNVRSVRLGSRQQQMPKKQEQLQSQPRTKSNVNCVKPAVSKQQLLKPPLRSLPKREVVTLSHTLLRSPQGVPIKSWEPPRSPQGVSKESPRSPQGGHPNIALVHPDSKDSPRTPQGLYKESTRSPEGLPI